MRHGSSQKFMNPNTPDCLHQSPAPSSGSIANFVLFKDNGERADGFLSLLEWLKVKEMLKAKRNRVRYNVTRKQALTRVATEYVYQTQDKAVYQVYNGGIDPFKIRIRKLMATGMSNYVRLAGAPEMKRVDVCVITRIICESHSNYKKSLSLQATWDEGFTLGERQIFMIEYKSRQPVSETVT